MNIWPCVNENMVQNEFSNMWNNNNKVFQIQSAAGFQPAACLAAAGKHLTAAAGCQQAVTQVESESVTHSAHTSIKKKPFFLHSISASSSSVSSTWARVWQFSCLMCPPLCRHQAKMQALLWDIPQGADVSQADKGVRVIYKKRYCFSASRCQSQWGADRFSGLCLLLFRGWWQPGQEVKVFVSVCMSQWALNSLTGSHGLSSGRSLVNVSVDNLWLFSPLMSTAIKSIRENEF